MDEDWALPRGHDDRVHSHQDERKVALAEGADHSLCNLSSTEWNYLSCNNEIKLICLTFVEMVRMHNWSPKCFLFHFYGVP